MTDASGNVVEALDYSPFGGLRIDTKSNYGGLRNKYAVAKSRQVEHMGDSGQLLLLLQIFRSAGVRVVYSERALTKTFSWNGPLRDRRIRKGEAVLDVGSLGHVLENPK